MLKFAFALCLIGGPSFATPVHTWSGATGFACKERCPQAWAEAQLNRDELAQLRAVQASHPQPQPIQINDGDVFSLVTYFNQKPMAYRTTTIATLARPEGAMGWIVGGWSWVKLDVCANWTKVERHSIGGTGWLGVATTAYPASHGVPTWTSASYGAAIPPVDVAVPFLPIATVFPVPPIAPVPPVLPPIVPVPPPVPPVSPVPLPASGMMLLAALVLVAARAKWRLI